MPDVKIETFNARGLRDSLKRRTLFRHLHHNYPTHVVILQETHSAERDEAYWQAEWGAPVLFSHGPNTSTCGVAVLLPRAMNGVCDVAVRYRDDMGRLLVLKLTFDRFELVICAVYAPTQGHIQQQIDFLNKLKENLDLFSENDSACLIVCGDFNLHLSELDTNSKQFRLSNPSKLLAELLEDFNLVDIWRERNASRRQYTWRRLNPLQQSRIDYVFVSDYLIRNHVLDFIQIKPGIQSDHSMVSMELTVFGTEKGRGLFRFDNRLLEDADFVHGVRQEIRKADEAEGIYADIVCLGLKLEMLTSEIRVKSIKLGKFKARERREQHSSLIENIEKCEKEMGQNPSEEIIARYEALRARLDRIEEDKGKLAMIYSGARWLEQGEKPTKYFLRLNARRNKEKKIDVLQSPDGTVINGRKEILRYCQNHFEEVYRSRGREDQGRRIEDYFQTVESPRLDDVDKRLCEGDITYQECEAALKGMLNNKAPSVSGFSKEFFIFFWPEIGNMVVNYINQAKRKGEFFVTQRRGVLTLLPKKGDQKFIKNKRAICLLDIVYKITAKVLATRIMTVLQKIVAADQTGSVRGRYIGSSLRTIADVIFYCNADELNGILMALDFKNAFNTVEHEFVYAALRKFNFGDDFISWIKLLHHNAELSVINNGFTSSWFQPSRGLQQGCPTSAPLFAIVVEILALKIRGTGGIRGISVSGKTFKISHYCDDTTLFVENDREASKAVQLVNEFGTISGLELNMDKCEFMWLGRQKESTRSICGQPPVDRTKILGVWFSATQDCSTLNVETIEPKVKTTLQLWSQRNLSIKGRITVAKSLIVSQLLYAMMATRIEEKMLTAIQGHIMKFLWRGRPPKVSRKTLTMDIKKGGLKAPDLILVNRAARIAWIGRMIRESEVSYSEVLHIRLRVNLNILVKADFDEKWIANRKVPQFYKEMLLWYKKLHLHKEPTTSKEIRQQGLWHNKFLNVQGETLVSNAQIELDVPMIDDLLNGEGRVLGFDEFLQRFPNVRVDPLTYIRWCRAIPSYWKCSLRGSAQLEDSERSERPTIMMNDKKVAITAVKSGYFYLLQIPDVIPTAQVRWSAEGVEFDNWAPAYERAFKTTASTKLQSLQFKITHRFFPTRRFLFIRKASVDPFCDNCGQEDTLEHYFFECAEVHAFWSELASKLNALGMTMWLTRDVVLFGSDTCSSLINLIILVAKQFIVEQNYRDECKGMSAFRASLFKMFRMEKCIATKNEKMEKFRNRWSPLIERDAFCF